jgi:DNA-binding NarL/FixJ family response regulator
MNMKHVLLADDHPLVRHGLKTVIEEQQDLVVVGEASDGLQALNEMERLKPDILVTDLSMPGLSGLEVTRQGLRLSPNTEVVILSMHNEEKYILQAFASGARGYVLKNDTGDEVIEAIYKALEGQYYLSPALAERAIETYVQRAQEAVVDPYETLTGREREILHLTCEGYTHAEIGARLSISPRTAEVHRTNLMRKLGLRNQAALIRYAMQRGILVADE